MNFYCLHRRARKAFQRIFSRFFSHPQADDCYPPRSPLIHRIPTVFAQPLRMPVGPAPQPNVLKDNTRGWTQTQTINETGFVRSSAEVITEAPCCTAGGGILPLADFGTINYTASTDNGSSMGTQSPTSIVMVDNSGLAKDSTSSMSSSGAFSNTWIRSN